MSHVDDGQLNALLDQELDPAEQRLVEGHLASCAQCRSRLEEARAFLVESGQLLDVLDVARPRISAVEPPKKIAVTAKEKAIEIPPGISKTLQEPAINIDGRTAKAAPSPFFPQAAERIAAQAATELKEQEAAQRRARWGDMSQLAWAATIVLAVGVGFLANEVLNLRERGAAAPEVAVVLNDSARPAAASDAQRAPERDRSGAGAGTTSDRLSRGTSPADRASRSAATPKPPTTGSAKPPDRAPVSNFSREPPRQNRPAEVAGVQGGRTDTARPLAAEERRQADSRDQAGAEGPALGNASRQRAAAPAPAPTAAMRAPASAPARAEQAGDVALRAFQRIDGDSAIRVLSGSMRLIDGLSPRLIEIGRGNLVPGADPDRDVVRVHYLDPSGRPLTLDQQPGDTRPGVTSVNGLMRGDTLMTSSPEGLRVRWVDRKNFWLSLTGPLTPEELRGVVERIR